MSEQIPARAQLYEELCEELLEVIETHGKMYTLLVPEILGCLKLVELRVIEDSESLFDEDDE